MKTAPINTAPVIEALALLHEPGEVFEIRILNVPKSQNSTYRVTFAGYFNDYAKAAHALKNYNGRANIYTTLNPVDPALLARANNRLREIGKTDPLTNDKNIIARRWLPLDFDYDRPAGISATTEEVEAARTLAIEVTDYLTGFGWPAPLAALSGNGAHRLYRIDLPNDAESMNLIKNVLAGLQAKFGGLVKIDQTVFNAARIWKMYGTLAVKGDNTPDRPHRLATIEAIPGKWQIVTPALLKAIAPIPAPVSVVTSNPLYQNGSGYTSATIESALTAAGVGFTQKQESNRTLYRLDKCLTSLDHVDGACVTLEPSGKAGYKCHHDTCMSKQWGDVRLVLFPTGTNTATGQAQNTKPTHDELRDRWLANQEPTAFGLGDWRQYDAGLWAVVPDLTVKAGISEIVEAAKVEGIRPSASIVSSVADLTKFKVAKPDSIWDANPDYLVCRNGAFCIPERTLQDHNPALFATSGVHYDYEPNALANHWQAFLFDLIANTSQDVVDFLQEFAGYALTTDTSHEIAIWLYGPPGSGKSTFLEGLQAALGARAGLLGLAEIASNRFALANLPGKTLVISTEQPSTFLASTDILNRIISGEAITVDRKFRDAIEVTPRCKIAWAMNELPRVSDPNSGLFRRVKVVEFPTIPEQDRDSELKERIKNEGAGILNWALEGLDRLRNRGRFDVPREILDATANFRDNNDIPARFVEDCCVTGYDQNNESYRVQSSQLYTAYKIWCLETGHKPQSSTSIANDWKRLGFDRYRANGRTFYAGVGLQV